MEESSNRRMAPLITLINNFLPKMPTSMIKVCYVRLYENNSGDKNDKTLEVVFHDCVVCFLTSSHSETEFIIKIIVIMGINNISKIDYHICCHSLNVGHFCM